MPPTEWHPYDNSQSIGKTGSEQGVIIRDEEHEAGARITLEQLENGLARFAITCGVYGWFFHTRYFGTLDEAQTAYREMQIELERIVDILPDADHASDGGEQRALNAISEFVGRFPT